MQDHPIVFWELASHDAEKSVAFLKDVFGWDIKHDDRIGLFRVPAAKSSQAMDGGIFTLKRAKLPFLTLYIKVEDIQARAKLVEEHGGFIVDPPQEIPGGSQICLFNEPSGVTLAMIQMSSE